MDTLSKENAVAERLEKEREQAKDRVGQHTMSRTSSRAASHRGEPRPTSSPTPTSPKLESSRTTAAPANVRPSFSFANAAAGKKDGPAEDDKKDAVDVITAKVDEVTI